MFVIRSNQNQTVVRFADSPISNYRPMNELHDYVKNLTGAYSVQSEYDYDASTDEYVIEYTDTETGKTYTVRSKKELDIARLVTLVATNVNLELV